MQKPRRGDFIRGLPAQAGTSVLAALVFVAVLSAVAFAVHAIVPSGSMAQTASTRVAFLEIEDTKKMQAAAEATPKLTTALLGAKRCKSPIEVQQDKTTQASFDANQDVVNTCVRGCEYKVAEVGGAIQVNSVDKCDGLAGDALKKCVADTACRVLDCVGENECALIPGNDAAGSKYLSDRFGVDPTVPIKASPDLQAALASGNQADFNKLPPYLQEVFKAQQPEVIAKNEAKIESYEGQIRDASNPTEVKRLESQIDILRNQNQRLASISIAKPEDQATLTPSATPREESSVVKPSQPGIAGQSSTFLSPQEQARLQEMNANVATLDADAVKAEEGRAFAEIKAKCAAQQHWGCGIITGKQCNPGTVRWTGVGRNCQDIVLTEAEKNNAFNRALDGIEKPNNSWIGNVPPQFAGKWDPKAGGDESVLSVGNAQNPKKGDPFGGASPDRDAMQSPGEWNAGRSGAAPRTEPLPGENFASPYCKDGTCSVNITTGEERRAYEAQGYTCRPSQETGTFGLVCIKDDASGTRQRGIAQGPCPDGQVINPDGTCPAPKPPKPPRTPPVAPPKVPPSGGQGTPCITSYNPLVVKVIPAGTPVPAGCLSLQGAPRPQATPNVWEQAANNFLKGFIQATISSNPFGGGYGQRGYGQGYGQGGYGGGQPPIGNSIPQPPGTCGVAQYCQNNMQYQRNTQCVDQPVQACQYGCNGNQCATSPQNQCPPPPPQPPVAACVGTWKQEITPGPAGLTCVTGWTCALSATTTPAATSTPPTADERPTAELSCAPLIADAGMSISISYACGNATKSTGTNFASEGKVSGTASAVAPNASTSTTYAILCENAEGLRASASCTVQIARPTIVFVVNPQQVLAGQQATVGWVTSGMKSCVVSSPDSSSFTSQNAGKTATSGTAQTPPIAGPLRLVLACETSGGNTKTATTTATLKQDGTPPTSIEENNGYCLAVAANSSQRLFLTNRGYQCDAATTNTSCSRLKGTGECI